MQTLNHLARGDDGDALVHTDGQQVLAIPGDDQFGSGGHGCRDDVVVINIADNDAWHAGGHVRLTRAVYCATKVATLAPKLWMRAANFG
jgi:hypothetical protein